MLREIFFPVECLESFWTMRQPVKQAKKLMKSDRFSNVGVHPSHLFELELFFLDKNEILLQYRFHNKLNTQLDSFSRRRTQRNPREQLAVEGTIAGSMFCLLEHAQSETTASRLFPFASENMISLEWRYITFPHLLYALVIRCKHLIHE